MKTVRLSLFVDAWLGNWKRFPLASLFVHVGTAFMLYLILYDGNYQEDEKWGRVILACLVGFPAALGVKTLIENGRMTKTNAIIAKATVLVLAVLTYLILHYRDTLGVDWMAMTAVGMAAAAHLFTVTAAFIGRKDTHHFWEHSRQLLANLVTGFVYTIILWGGISLAILAIDKLFEIDLDTDVYTSWWAISWGLMSTGYFMYHFPKDLEYDANEMVFNQFYLSVTKYLFIPLTALYFFILYLYGGKIAVQWELPHGWISSLCIGFSIAGIFTWLLNYLLPDWHEGKILEYFKNWFWPLTFPVIALLMVGIGRRLSDYGITEERYFVATTAVWLLLNCLYFTILPKNKQLLWFLPVSLMAGILFTLFGPFNARAMTWKNQVSRLEKELSAHGLWNGQKLSRPDQPTQVSAALIDGIHFLGNRDSTALLETLQLTNQKAEVFRAGVFDPGEIVHYLKLEQKTDDPASVTTNFGISNELAQMNYPIKGATMRIQGGYKESGQAPSLDQYTVLLAENARMAFLNKGGIRLDTLSLQSVQDTFFRYYQPTNQFAYQNSKLYPITLEGKKHRVLYMPYDLSGRLDSTGRYLLVDYLNGDFYLMDGD